MLPTFWDVPIAECKLQRLQRQPKRGARPAGPRSPVPVRHSPQPAAGFTHLLFPVAPTAARVSVRDKDAQDPGPGRLRAQLPLSAPPRKCHEEAGLRFP